MIDATNTIGLVLTCSHLFDNSTGHIVVTFADGRRFAARFVDRDRPHDLAALAINRPHAAAMAVNDSEPSGTLNACGFGPNGQFRSVTGNVTGRDLNGYLRAEDAPRIASGQFAQRTEVEDRLNVLTSRRRLPPGVHLHGELADYRDAGARGQRSRVQQRRRAAVQSQRAGSAAVINPRYVVKNTG